MGVVPQGSGIEEIISSDASITVTDPMGPVVDLTGAGGGVALCNAAPAGVLPNNVAAPGVAVDAARCDHVHALPTAAPITAQGALNSVGSSNAVARADHQHAVAVQVFDEGIDQGTAFRQDFTGAGVTASVLGGVATIDVPGGGAGGVTCEFAGATNTVSQSSVGTWSLISGMSLTGLAEGRYMVWLNCDTDVLVVGTRIAIRHGISGVPIADSERACDMGSDRLPCATQTIVDVGEETPTVIEGVVQTGALGTTFRFRSIMAIRCGDVPP